MPKFDPSDPRSYDPYYIEQEELTRFKNLPTIDTEAPKPNFAVTQLPDSIAPSSKEESSVAKTVSAYQKTKTDKNKQFTKSHPGEPKGQF